MTTKQIPFTVWTHPEYKPWFVELNAKYPLALECDLEHVNVPCCHCHQFSVARDEDGWIELIIRLTGTTPGQMDSVILDKEQLVYLRDVLDKVIVDNSLQSDEPSGRYFNGKRL